MWGLAGRVDVDEKTVTFPASVAWGCLDCRQVSVTGLLLGKAEATPRSVMQVACTISVQFGPLCLCGCESWS